MPTDEKEFDILIQSLKFGEHQYSYKINKEFFEVFPYEDITKPQVEVQLTLKKSERLVEANFVIKGTVELICDRSVKPFTFSISNENKVLFKFAEAYEELDVDTYAIPYSVDILNVGQHILEQIALSVPMKKIHPDYLTDEEEEEDEHPEILYSSAEDDESSEENSDICDPRWEALKKLK